MQIFETAPIFRHIAFCTSLLLPITDLSRCVKKCRGWFVSFFFFYRNALHEAFAKYARYRFASLQPYERVDRMIFGQTKASDNTATRWTGRSHVPGKPSGPHF